MSALSPLSPTPLFGRRGPIHVSDLVRLGVVTTDAPPRLFGWMNGHLWREQGTSGVWARPIIPLPQQLSEIGDHPTHRKGFQIPRRQPSRPDGRGGTARRF